MYFFRWISYKIRIFYLRAYDRAAIKFRGIDADINFNVCDYDEDIKQVGLFKIILITNRQSNSLLTPLMKSFTLAAINNPDE